MLAFEMTIYGTPIGWKAPGCDRGRHFTPPRYAEYKHMLIDAMLFHDLEMRHAGETFRGMKDWLLNLDIEIYICKNIGDRTNFQKGIEDALQSAGIIWNDKQIVDGRSRLSIDKQPPRIWFKLTRIEP